LHRIRYCFFRIPGRTEIRVIQKPDSTRYTAGNPLRPDIWPLTVLSKHLATHFLVTKICAILFCLTYLKKNYKKYKDPLNISQISGWISGIRPYRIFSIRPYLIFSIRPYRIFGIWSYRISGIRPYRISGI
jgi:hypothetical protein